MITLQQAGHNYLTLLLVWPLLVAITNIFILHAGLSKDNTDWFTSSPRIKVIQLIRRHGLFSRCSCLTSYTRDPRNTYLCASTLIFHMQFNCPSRPLLSSLLSRGRCLRKHSLAKCVSDFKLSIRSKKYHTKIILFNNFSSISH